MSLLEAISPGCQMAESRAYHGEVLVEQKLQKDFCHLVDQNVSGAGGAHLAGWAVSIKAVLCALSSASLLSCLTLFPGQLCQPCSLSSPGASMTSKSSPPLPKACWASPP